MAISRRPGKIGLRRLRETGGTSGKGPWRGGGIPGKRQPAVPWTGTAGCAEVRLAGDLAGLDAGGAHVQPLRRAVHHCAHGLDVRVPAAAGAAVRVGDVVAEGRLLSANVADGSHGSLLISVERLDPPH